MLILILLIVTGCRQSSHHNPWHIWSSAAPDFDSVVELAERAYGRNLGHDTIRRLTDSLVSMSGRMGASSLMKGRAHYFRARLLQNYTSYADHMEEVKEEIKKAYACYGDTSGYPYDMFRLYELESRLPPRDFERQYHDGVAIISKARQFGDSITMATAFINLGITLRRIGDDEAAFDCFREARHIFRQFGMTDWYKRASLSIAKVLPDSMLEKRREIYTDLRDYAKTREDTLLTLRALHNLYLLDYDPDYLHECISLTSSNSSYKSLASYYSAGMALHYLKLSEKTVSGLGNKDFIGRKKFTDDEKLGLLYADKAMVNYSEEMLPEYSIIVFSSIAAAKAMQGDTASALDAVSKYIHLTDSLSKVNSGREVVKTRALREMTKSRLEVQRVSEQRKLTMLAVALPLIILFIGILMALMRRRDMLRRIKAKTELSLVQSRLQLAMSRLAIQEHSNVMKSASRKINSLMSSGVMSSEDMDDIRQALEQNLDISGAESFQKSFSELNPDFEGRLKERWPSLTDGQLRLCSYIAMGLNNRQISAVTGMGYNSLLVTRHRLRNRLGLKKDERLEDVLGDYTTF